MKMKAILERVVREPVSSAGTHVLVTDRKWKERKKKKKNRMKESLLPPRGTGIQDGIVEGAGGVWLRLWRKRVGRDGNKESGSGRQ